MLGRVRFILQSGYFCSCCVCAFGSISKQEKMYIHGTIGNTAGHNKWSKIKRPKMAADLERSKLTAKICSEIMRSVKLGGDNPDSNLRLVSILSRARKAAIPKVTIQNAIEAATTVITAGGEHLTIVGRGLGGYSLIIEAVTNNKRRTRPEIKQLLTKHGCSLMPEATSFNFQQKGVVVVSSDKESGISEETKAFELAINIGAEDVLNRKYYEEFESHCFKFICDIQDLRNVVSKAERESLDVLQVALEYVPTITVSLANDELQNAKELITLLRHHEEVTNVYYNIDNADM